MDTLSHALPGSLPEDTYISQTVAALAALGLNRDNTLAYVGLCRDEICQPFLRKLHATWGNPFDLSGLAGMLFAGATAFAAGAGHAPDGEHRRRHVFYVLTHIGLDATGTWGPCERPGMNGPTSACGALVGFQRELASGRLDMRLDLDDLEYSLLKQRLTSDIPRGETPDLLALTQLTHDVILEDLERMIARVFALERHDYAVFTGIQIHLPDGHDQVWPGACHAVMEGDRRALTLGA